MIRAKIRTMNRVMTPVVTAVRTRRVVAVVVLSLSVLWGLACGSEPADEPADTTVADTSEPDAADDTAATAPDDAGDDTAGESDSVADSTADSAADTGAADTSAPDDVTPGPPPIPTGDAAALEAWLAAGHYRAWPSESAPHDSAGPHFGDVRVFVSSSLDASLAAGQAAHPAGAAAVKELYGDGSEVLGYSVTVKLADDSAGGDNWYWYERFGTSVYADEAGAGLCTGCHGGGADFVLIPYPLQ